VAGISVSDEAAKKIHGLLQSQQKPEHGLRLKVVGGGCSGLQYKIDLDTPRDGDKVFENDGAKVLVDRKSFLYLNGTEVHYEEGLMESGFKLRNPNIKRACGCGASFTV
jgi:iron-sulfur cluster assembly accessory protein